MAYGLLGAVLSGIYYFCPRLREEPFLHLVTGLVLLVLMVLIPVATSMLLQPTGLRSGGFKSIEAYEFSLNFFLFLGASITYVPVIVFLLLHYWQVLLERITSPASRGRPSRRRNAFGGLGSLRGLSSTGVDSEYDDLKDGDSKASEAEKWERIQSNMEILTADPTNVAAHERLGDIYASMGFPESAVYEYRKAADWLGRGYAQGHMLYKAAHLLVEKKGDIPAALILLRRIVRLYPKSYFASYARRVINHYEAHADEAIPD